MLRMPKDHQISNLSSVAVAALVGGLAGVVVGLMLAPKSGKDIRHGLYKKADDTVEHFKDVSSLHAGTVKHQGTDLVDKGIQLAEDLQTFIQEALKLRKSSFISNNIAKDTQTEESLPNIPEIEIEIDPPAKDGQVSL